MTNEKSQVAVKLTAEDINKYLVKNNFYSLIKFLKEFRGKGLTVNDFKYRIIRKGRSESTIILMDSTGHEHICFVPNLFLKNIDKILTDLLPSEVFVELIHKEIKKLQTHIKDLEKFIGII